MGQLATAAIPLPFTDFHGGLNTRDQPYLLEQDQARDLDNLQGTAAGALVKRTGLTTLATPPVTLTSIFALESVAPTVLVGAGGTALYSVAAGGAVTSLASGLTANLPWEFVSAPVVSSQGPLYGMNGTDTPQQWNGSAGSTSAWTNASGSVAVPNGKYCIYANNQVFVTGVAATPSRVFWSALADPTNWDPASLTGAGFMDFDPDDGEAIAGIGVVGPYILVGKPRKLWVITNVATAAARSLSQNVGIVSHRSLAESSTAETYFLSEDRGVYVTNGTKITPISDILTPTFQSLSPGLKNQAAGHYYQSHYYLSVPLNSTTNDTTLDYDEVLASWWKHTFGSNQFEVWHPSPGNAFLYSAKATSAIVDHCFTPNVYEDNGQPMTWVYRGPWQSPVFFRHKWYQTPYYRKRLRQLRVEGYGTVDFSLAKDFAVQETLWAADVFTDDANSVYGAPDGSVYGALDGTHYGGSADQIQRARFFTMGVANAFSIVFSATSSTPDAIASFIMMITGRRDLVFQD